MIGAICMPLAGLYCTYTRQCGNHLYIVASRIGMVDEYLGKMLQARRRFSRRSGREPSPPRSSTRRSPVCSRASAQLRSWRWWRLVTRRLRRRLFGVVARAVGGKLAGEILKYTSRLRVKLFRAAKHFAGFSGIAWRNFDDLVCQTVSRTACWRRFSLPSNGVI